MIAIRSQWRAFVADASPAVYRILLHGMLYGLSFSISDMLFNFYLHSLQYLRQSTPLVDCSAVH